MKRSTYILFFLLSLTTVIYANPGKKYLKLIRENYLNLNQVAVQLDYTLYKGYSSDSIVQNYASLYRRFNQNQYRRVQDIELINIDSLSLKINHKNKTVSIVVYQPLNYLDFNIQKTLSYCERIELKELGKKGYEVSLILKQKLDIPFTKVRIEVDKKNWIKRIVLFYATQINFSDSYFETDMANPKLVIDYQDIEKNWTDKDSILDLKKYLILKNNFFLLTPAYAGYVLQDNRR